MSIFRIFIFLIFITSFSCRQLVKVDQSENCFDNSANTVHMDEKNATKGALLSTRFNSFEELKDVVLIENTSNKVRLTHCSNGKEVLSIMVSGVNENDFAMARDGGLWDRIKLILKSPYAVRNRRDLQRVRALSKRRSDLFEKGTLAFYDISEKILKNIDPEDAVFLDPKDLHSEKGYFNTINHITAQAFMTSLFSEELADLVADSHERKNLPELVSGNFTEDQLKDLKEGPVDNYVDMINNEWGQELGKLLKQKHQIHKESDWTPELMASYLNDLQHYYSWAFLVSFKPFRPEDELVKDFSYKVMRVME